MMSLNGRYMYVNVQWISVAYVGVVTCFWGPVKHYSSPPLHWYSLLVSWTPWWPAVVGNRYWWRTLDGCKSILRNNDTHRRSQWGPLIFAGGQRVPPLNSNGYRRNWTVGSSSFGHITGLFVILRHHQQHLPLSISPNYPVFLTLSTSPP